MTTKVIIREKHPKGGFKTHLVPVYLNAALCGYAPQSYGTNRMKDRSGWWLGKGIRPCEACIKARARMEAKGALFHTLETN